CQNHNGHPLTF
nr:immunoglobulin light chain junction region [Macaca mulatta]MOW55034.1 immunoglobulin light chain junction region [Macaca mulatta]